MTDSKFYRVTLQFKDITMDYCDEDYDESWKDGKKAIELSEESFFEAYNMVDMYDLITWKVEEIKEEDYDG